MTFDKLIKSAQLSHLDKERDLSCLSFERLIYKMEMTRAPTRDSAIGALSGYAQPQIPTP